ncbi:MAG: hypothetical protein JO245_10600 [Pseudolabrys sp.]|nr:hypothetical protein [Pseudolabrys sp.]
MRLSRILTAAFFVLAALIVTAQVAPAQAPADGPGGPPVQIKLSEAQVKSYIASAKDVQALAEKSQGTAENDPKIVAEFDAISRKHGFKDSGDYALVASNIAMIMAGLDPQTKAFSEPRVVIQREINEITNDKSIPAADKKQILAELNAALKTAEPIKNRENIELVKKYFAELEQTQPQQ